MGINKMVRNIPAIESMPDLPAVTPLDWGSLADRFDLCMAARLCYGGPLC
jgi:hypothetical protein